MLLRLLKALFARRRAAPQAPQPRPQRAGVVAAPGEVMPRLAAIARGAAPAAPAGPPQTIPYQPSASYRTAEMVERAAGLQAERLEPDTEARVAQFAAAFSAAARPGSGPAVFAFHVDLEPGSEVRHVDIRFTPGEFDYLEILRHCAGRVRAHCPGATIYLVCAPGSRYRALAADDLVTVELPLGAAQPMYDRATALTAFARSAAFDRDTVFLDSDALVNRPLGDVFALGFDVGLTYRDSAVLMPVNEGVMFLRAQRRAAVEAFLTRRLATYDRIAADPQVREYYGDVRRWRGGQLSLNALAHGVAPFSPYRRCEVAGAQLRFLPCDTFNFAPADGEAPGSLETLAARYVLHYKGWRKYALSPPARAGAG